MRSRLSKAASFALVSVATVTPLLSDIALLWLPRVGHLVREVVVLAVHSTPPVYVKFKQSMCACVVGGGGGGGGGGSDGGAM